MRSTPQAKENQSNRKNSYQKGFCQKGLLGALIFSVLTSLMNAYFVLSIFVFSTLGISFISSPLQAQKTKEDKKSIVSQYKQEIGGFFGIASAVPRTTLGRTLSSDFTGGAWYRINWPWVFYLEAVFGGARLQSKEDLSARFFPMYGALGYRLPLRGKLDLFLKTGFGAAHIYIEPQKISGWEPLFTLGTELSISAANFIRIGVRLDYLLIIESNLSAPANARPDRPIPEFVIEADPRLQETPFQMINGHFFVFGLTIAYVF